MFLFTQNVDEFFICCLFADWLQGTNDVASITGGTIDRSACTISIQATYGIQVLTFTGKISGYDIILNGGDGMDIMLGSSSSYEPVVIYFYRDYATT